MTIVEEARKLVDAELDDAVKSSLELWSHYVDQYIEKEDFSDGVMIAFGVDDPDIELMQERLFGDEGVKPLHITLYYLGKVSDFELIDLESMKMRLEEFAQSQAPVDGLYNGYAVFGEETDGKYPLVLLYDSPQMPILRYHLRSIFPDAIDQEHGFTPHTTLAYVDEPQELDIQKYPVRFDKIGLYFGDNVYEYPLTGDVVEKQLPITDENRKTLMDLRTNIFNDEADVLAERLFTGDISIGSWEESMKQLIRELHTSMAAIGKGGWDEMTQSDWGRLGNPLKAQYRYLHGFAEAIAEKRDVISLKAIQARAHLYGVAGGHSTALIQAGRIIADLLPWIPKDGSTECLVGCKCFWRLDVIDQVGDFNLVQAVWNLRPAEHCGDCIDRRGHTEIIRVHKTVEVPPIIGGY